MNDIIDEVKEQITNQIQEFGNDVAAQMELFKIVLIIHGTVSVVVLLLVIAVVVIVAVKKH